MEFHDPPAELSAKLDRLAALLQDAGGRTCVLTGAGVSAAADIPTFRGAGGLDENPVPLVCIGAAEKTLDTVMPTYAHVALARMLESGMVAAIATSNHDGLHQRAGAPADSVADVFGNVYVEQCVRCAARFRRSVVVPALGRSCSACGGRLLKTGTRMGAATPAEPLAQATRFARAAELALVLGSSMTVSPFCELPGLARRGFVLVTLQKTAYDDEALLCIHAEADVVMRGLLERLGCQGLMQDPFVYTARMRLVGSDAGSGLRLEGATPEEPPTWAECVSVDGAAVEKNMRGVFAADGLPPGERSVTVSFVDSAGCDPVTVAFDPAAGEELVVEAPRVVVFSP